mmetsp:Transcript_22450/g.73707  ORF Transcript_22450/g.73707 Transcript_22450/m.73707 type:complete len:343 (-) Transcript_22450:169-1197(-)
MDVCMRVFVGSALSIERKHVYSSLSLLPRPPPATPLLELHRAGLWSVSPLVLQVSMLPRGHRTEHERSHGQTSKVPAHVELRAGPSGSRGNQEWEEVLAGRMRGGSSDADVVVLVLVPGAQLRASRIPGLICRLPCWLVLLPCQHLTHPLIEDSSMNIRIALPEGEVEQRMCHPSSAHQEEAAVAEFAERLAQPDMKRLVQVAGERDLKDGNVCCGEDEGEGRPAAQVVPPRAIELPGYFPPLQGLPHLSCKLRISSCQVLDLVEALGEPEEVVDGLGGGATHDFDLLCLGDPSSGHTNDAGRSSLRVVHLYTQLPQEVAVLAPLHQQRRGSDGEEESWLLR